MKNIGIIRAAKRIMALTLAAVIGLSVPMASLAAAVKDANYVITDVDGAKSALEKLASERNIAAAIYLKDSYILKSEADQYSEDVVALASGQSISIASVAVDEGRNIWYKVNYNLAGSVISGYVEREFVACADERFLNWEDKYITTTSRESVRKDIDCSDIEQFPKSYRDALYELKKKHPNWIFVRQNVGLDWKTVLYQESLNERSLISKSADSSYKAGPSAGTAGWYIASDGIIAYYMDPRNFFTEERVFMFEQQTYNETAHSVEAVQKILNGTFMAGGYAGSTKTYAQTFVEIGASLNMSPMALATRVKQEQGVEGTSPLISGKYSGFEGYYNYFNIKANGSTKEATYINGLTEAKKRVWNTIEKSLAGGASIISNYYVHRGQDTLYLQKFDVDASDKTLYTHQYMQNIAAPYSESSITYKAYNNAGLLNNTFVFKIPVYDNMPSGRSIKPDATDVLSLNVDEVKNLPVDQNAVLVSLINGGQNNDVSVTYTSSDEKIAKVDSNGVVTGIRPGNVTISAKRTENATNTAVCKINVIKADIAVSKIPVPSLSTTYLETQTLKDIELPDGFAWADDSIVPAVDNEGYSVIYNPDNSKYNQITITVPINVAKATYDIAQIDMPKNLTVDAGAELATVILPEGFVWEDSSYAAPLKTGNIKSKAIYCADPAGFDPLTVELEIKVVCKTHDFTDWEGTHADCKNDGELTRTCKICGKTETLTEDALGHKYTSEVTKEPTAKQAGIRTYTCERCGDTYNEEIPKLKDNHVHQYVGKVTKEPGCLTEGVMTYTCSCNDSYEEPVDPLGHDYDDLGVCKRCGYKLPVVPIHVHDFTLSECTATCTESGENVYTCGCGESYREPAEKLGHNMKNGVCTRCGLIDTTASLNKEEESAKATPTPTSGTTPKPTTGVTPTPTPSTTSVPTPTVVPTKGVTPTPAPTAIPTPTAVPTKGVTPTPEPTAIPTPTTVPTKAVTPTSVPTPTAVPVKEATPTKAPATTPASEAKVTAMPTIEPLAEPTSEIKESYDKKSNENKKATPVAPEIERVDEFEKGEKPAEIVMMSSTVLDKDKIEEYTSKDNRKLRITMANDVVWDIDLTGENIDDVSLNLKVELDGEKVEASNTEDIIGNDPFICIEIGHEGVFGFPVTLHIPSKTEYAGKIANLFYNNPATGLLEYVNDTIVEEDGDTAFILEHASQYVIVYADMSLKPIVKQEYEEDITDTGDDGKEGAIILSTPDNDSGADNNTVYIYVIATVAVLVILLSVITVLLIRRKREDEYFDEED